MDDAVWGDDTGAQGEPKFPEIPALGAEEGQRQWQWISEEGQPGVAGLDTDSVFGSGRQGDTPLQPPTV